VLPISDETGFPATCSKVMTAADRASANPELSLPEEEEVEDDDQAERNTQQPQDESFTHRQSPEIRPRWGHVTGN
jgi:hypothetical protein